MLNPQGGNVLINAPGSSNNTTGLLLQTSGLDFVIQNNNTGRLYLNTNNTNVIQIQGGGSSGTGIVGINGGPNANYALNVNGNILASGVINASGFSSSGTINANGNITSTGTITAASYNATSDYRIKKDVVTIDDSFTVDNLRPVTYNNSKNGKQDIGLIAHELQEVYPELVTGEKDGEEMQSVNYTGLIPILIKEIQDLKARVKELELKNII